jgi:hypothetical protein
MFEVACNRCERHARVGVARLIDEHVANTGLPDLWQTLAGGLLFSHQARRGLEVALAWVVLSADLRSMRAGKR